MNSFVACELAGNFFLEQNLNQKSHSCFKRSIACECYENWGALAEESLKRSLGQSLKILEELTHQFQECLDL